MSTQMRDQATLDFAVDFCKREFSVYGILAIYLVGSRAYGSPRENSDHDVLVVLSDKAPADLSMGGALHMKVFAKLERERKALGLGAIDLITLRESRFEASKDDPTSFAGSVGKGGISLFP